MAGVQHREGGDVRRLSANGARQFRRPADGEVPRGLAEGPPTSRTGADGSGAPTAGHGPASACAYDRYDGMTTRPGASSAATSCARTLCLFSSSA
jgi:hypothetical protein